jgi:hypothetical protein
MQHRSLCRDAAEAASEIHSGTKDIIPMGAWLTNYKRSGLGMSGMPQNIRSIFDAVPVAILAPFARRPTRQDVRDRDRMTSTNHPALVTALEVD